MKPAVATVICLAMVSTGAVGAAAKPAFEPRPCKSEAAAAGARCGVVYVPEDHEQHRGRKIGLSVVILPALKPEGVGGIAQFDLEGGPGFAATDFVAFYAGEGAPYRQHRDVVLADMRGTGDSNPLRCAGIEELEKRAPWAPMYPPALVAECAQQLSVANDLAAYSTRAASRDIELIRRALAYDRLDLNAVSYGTTLALRYIADYPRRVHAAVLLGTVPANRTPPRFHSQAATGALQALNTDSYEILLAIRAQLATHPLIGPDVFAEKVRNLLYAPAASRQLPALLSRAKQGDFAGFARGGYGSRVFADGLYLSITCAESLARIDVEAAIVDASRTPFGAYRLERQRDACAQWTRAHPDPELMKSRPSKVPALFIAGNHDPVAPVEWARETAARFVDSRFVNVAHGGHVLDGLSGLDTCLDARILDFFDRGTARGLDVACFDSMKPLPPAP